jgi:hypothetical protein
MANSWETPETPAAKAYKRATERAAALKFLADTFEGEDPAAVKAIRNSISKVLTPEVTWSDRPEGRPDSGGFARDSEFTDPRIEALAHQSEMANYHALHGPQSYSLARQMELERSGRAPTFRSVSIEPGYVGDDGRADEDDTAERAARAREQAALTEELHSKFQGRK